jgi:hypothetical protein
MTAAIRPIGRRFPDYGWVWPRGDHDQLLRAVLDADAEAALAGARAWLAGHDIDVATGRDLRLLTAVADRFGAALAGLPAYPRLKGLQRLHWSRSRLAEAAAAEILADLAARGLPFLLIKGAARIALDPAARRGRAAHDVDVLVRPADFGAVFDILHDHGWHAATGLGPLHLRSRLAGIRALNFLKGGYGDLDLHQAAYHPHQADAGDEAGLWTRAVAATYAGAAARVPAPADQIALAIGHGSLDAHVHSDWLVDIDRIVRRGGVDWDGLAEVLRRRRLQVPAAAALTYLGLGIGTPIPATFLAGLVAEADAAGWRARAALLEMKPRSDFTRVSGVARGVAKMLRLWRARPAGGDGPLWRARWGRPARLPEHAGETAAIALPPAPAGAASRTLRLRLALKVALPAGRRRIEFELTGRDRFVMRLRYRKHRKAAGARLLVFSGTLALPAADDVLTLTARPARHLRPSSSPEERAAYAAVAFELDEVSLSDA